MLFRAIRHERRRYIKIAQFRVVYLATADKYSRLAPPWHTWGSVVACNGCLPVALRPRISGCTASSRRGEEGPSAAGGSQGSTAHGEREHSPQPWPRQTTPSSVARARNGFSSGWPAGLPQVARRGGVEVGEERPRLGGAHAPAGARRDGRRGASSCACGVPRLPYRGGGAGRGSPRLYPV